MVGKKELDTVTKQIMDGEKVTCTPWQTEKGQSISKNKQPK